jgi:uncharacterized protein DUF6458
LIAHRDGYFTCTYQGKGAYEMGISFSILLIAVGAVLAWAVSADVSGVDVQVMGVILLIVGIIGFITSLVFWSSWGGFGGARDTSGAGGNAPQTTIIKD